MGIIWFCLVAVMIAGYVVLDGFDIGVGVLHLLARAQRRGTARADPVYRARLGRERGLASGRRAARSISLFPRFTPRASAGSIFR